jgi:hypothetical protein
MERIEVQGHPRQKVSETPSSTNKLGMVVCNYNPSFPGYPTQKIAKAKRGEAIIPNSQAVAKCPMPQRSMNG